MNNFFLLTWPHLSVYAGCAIAKSMDGFDSLLSERIWPLCGFFYVRNLFALFVFMGGYLGEHSCSPVSDPVCQPDLSARPCLARAAVFSKP